MIRAMGTDDPTKLLEPFQVYEVAKLSLAAFREAKAAQTCVSPARSLLMVKCSCNFYF